MHIIPPSTRRATRGPKGAGPLPLSANELKCFLGVKPPAPSPVHKLLGNFSVSLRLFSNFQLVEQLSVHRTTLKFCASIVTVMLLLRVKQLKNAVLLHKLYSNIAYVKNIFVQSFSFTIMQQVFL